MDPIVEVNNLYKSFRYKNKRIEAVKGISFKIYKNEIFALVGPNGAGKTTTIKAILNLILPDKGDIEIFGLKLPQYRQEIMRKIGTILEGSRNIYWNMSIKENVYYFCNLKGKKIKEIKHNLEYWLERLGLQEKIDTPVGKLSRGMQQKASLLCALSINPELIICDEPTEGLDVTTRMELINVFKELQQQGKTLFLSSHDLNFLEKIVERIAIINKGEIVEIENINELKRKFFLNSYRMTLKKGNATNKYLEDVKK